MPATPDAVAKNTAKILICHGALDPSGSQDKIDAYLKSMNDAKLDYQFVVYAGAYHAFTNPASDATAAKFPGMKGFIAYSPTADHRSWQDMQVFFDEIFGASKG